MLQGNNIFLQFKTHASSTCLTPVLVLACLHVVLKVSLSSDTPYTGCCLLCLCHAVLFQQQDLEGSKSIHGNRSSTTATTTTTTTTITTSSATVTAAAPSMGVQNSPFLNNSSVAAFLQRLSCPTPSKSGASRSTAALHDQGPSSVVLTSWSPKTLETCTAPVEEMCEKHNRENHDVMHLPTSDAHVEAQAQARHGVLDVISQASRASSFGCSHSMDAEGCNQTDADCQTEAADQQHVLPFEDWLQCAEKEAAAAALLCGSMFGSKPDITGAKPMTLATPSQYHRQLEDMLQAVEQFELQLSQKPCLLSLAIADRTGL